MVGAGPHPLERRRLHQRRPYPLRDRDPQTVRQTAHLALQIRLQIAVVAHHDVGAIGGA